MHETPSMSTDDSIPDTQRMVPTTLEARSELDDILDALGAGEVSVLVRIAERLRMGAATYGPLRLAVDPRDFRSKEAREELEDALVYLACAWLKAEVQGGAR